MAEHLDVAVVGAGPYGLSIGSQLIASGLNVRVFGRPMQMWRSMLEGMMLKSYGSASNLTAPGNAYPLKAYATEFGIPYQDFAHDVTLANFASYGLEFQKRYVGEVDEADITGLSRADDGFALITADGRAFTAKQVVLAIGVRHFAHHPKVFASLPAGRVSHSIDHSSMAAFRGQDVTVVGAGSSAVEAAVALLREGATTHVLVRRDHIPFPSRAPGRRGLLHTITQPPTGLESGWSGVLLQNMPDAFRLLPARTRIELVRTYLGPRPVWRLKQAIEPADIRLSTSIESAAMEGDTIVLGLKREGSAETLRTDHIVLGTGFVADVQRLSFIDQPLRDAIATNEGWPVLDAGFQSSIKGLYFAGNAAAATFGPLMRFVLGTKFAAGRISRAIAKRR
jgi:cation diffusion facilitator CzcD-associated flavoprotein CzcO